MTRTKWGTGDSIRVRFMEGDPGLQERVKKAAMEWTKHANLMFEFVEEGDAEIRIAFKQGAGSWSYLGKDCLAIPKDEPTMNFGWLTSESSDEDIQSVVLHEFGHALGLIHEHQNPQGAIEWNKDAVRRDLSGPPNFWDDAAIKNNVFKHYSGEEITGTPVDAESIMMYPIPKAWTLDGFSAGMNGKLSQNDIRFIKEFYLR